MNLSPLEITYIAGAFTVLGALIGGLCSYYINVSIAAQNAKLMAGIKLRAAFIDDLATLKLGTLDVMGVYDLLKSKLINHQIAVTEFSLHLNGDRFNLFCEAWKNYYAYTGDDIDFDYEFLAKYHTPNSQEGKKLAVKNIKSILSFALPNKI